MLHPSERPIEALPPAPTHLPGSGAAADRAAFTALYDRVGSRAYSLAHHICGDAGVAADVVDEAFAAFWRDPGGVDRDPVSAAVALLTLVQHLSVDARRTSRGRGLASLGLPGESASASDAGDTAPDGVVDPAVRAALDALAPAERAALASAYFGGHTQEEIASTSGVDLGVVRSRTLAALGGLRGALSAPAGSDGVSDEHPSPGRRGTRRA